ncbi:MAG: hypothetical protein M5U26_05970 [Planctomycetota bacterium]|nr:hypothetical protein [Planctomycetota bacterium]
MNEGIVQDYIRRVAAGQLERRRLRIEHLEGADDLRRRQDEIRQVAAEILGACPERTALNVQAVSALDREGYRVEILTYECCPGMVVTANLYRPARAEAPAPAVLLLSNHNVEGKAGAVYQRLAQLFARRGIVTLVADQLGQGERIQFFDVTLRRSWIGQTVPAEHTHLGNMLFLTGQHLGLAMAWEAVRGLDLLGERPDVDARRLGVLGLDGGSALLRYLCVLDERPAAAACGLHPEELDPLGGGCIEQNLFGALARGVTPADLLVPFAPRPLLLAYPVRAAKDEPVSAYLKDLGDAYAFLGAESRLETVELDQHADLGRVLRARLAEFFARAFALPDSDAREPQTPTEQPAVLCATETGQVGKSLSLADLFSHHRERARALPPAAELPRDAEAARGMQEQLRARFRARLGMPEPHGPVEGHVESHGSDWGLAVEKGRLIVEDGVYLPYAFYTPPEDDQGRQARPTVLAVHERGVAAISAIGDWMKRLAQGGLHVMAIDVRGAGETRVQPERQDGDAYERLLLGEEATWARRALNVGLDLFGMRVFDVLRTLEYLRTRWEVQPEHLNLVGVGRGALWALYAAALDAKVERAVLFRGLSTYKCLVENRLQNHHFSLFLPGVLNDYDLPHVAACVAPRGLTLLNAVDQRRERLDAAAADRAYAFARQVYKRFDAADALKIESTDHAPATLKALERAVGIEGR